MHIKVHIKVFVFFGTQFPALFHIKQQDRNDLEHEGFVTVAVRVHQQLLNIVMAVPNANCWE